VQQDDHLALLYVWNALKRSNACCSGSYERPLRCFKSGESLVTREALVGNGPVGPEKLACSRSVD
jgi:hypothetical protein